MGRPRDDHRKQVVLDVMAKGATTADRLARSAGCCERTVYRYVSILRSEGHSIISGSGFGYMLRKRAPSQEAERHG